MVININNVANLSKTTPTATVKFDQNAAEKQGKAIEQKTAGDNAKVVDITLSEDITTAFEKISERANNVDFDRVAQLKQQIADGTLSMNIDTIAGNIINSELHE